MIYRGKYIYPSLLQSLASPFSASTPQASVLNTLAPLALVLLTWVLLAGCGGEARTPDSISGTNVTSGDNANFGKNAGSVTDAAYGKDVSSGRDTRSGIDAGGGINGETESSLTVHDMLGRSVVIPADVRRVIGLRAGALRMLTYLDAVDLVAGIEEPERRSERPYLTAFPELRDLPTVGPQMGGDPELLVAAAPDLIFLTFTSRGQADELQERTGIPVIALEYGDFSENRENFFSSLRLMAEVIGKSGRADTLIAGIRASIAELKDRTTDISDEDRPRAYIGGVSYRGARGITSTEPHYPPLRFIQANNVAGGIHQRLINPIQGTYIDREQLIVWDPDVMFLDLFSLSTAGPDIRPGTPLARSLTAVRNGEVYGVLPYNNYAANYEAILVNAWYAGTVLYPDRFDDITLSEKADQIFEMFFGRPIYTEIQARYGGYRRLNPEQL